jgi:hypothetical protein
MSHGPKHRRMPFSHSIRRVCALTALALTACHHAEQAEREPAGDPQRADAVADPGAPVLAAVLDARAAIAADDRVAALNDADLALSDAVRLAGAQSALYPPEAAPPGYRDRSGGGANGGAGGGRGAGRHHHGGAGPAAGGRPWRSRMPAAPPPTPSPQAAAQVGAHHRGHEQGGHAGAAAPPAGSAGISSFEAQVRLVSAKSELLSGDVAGADAQLKAIASAAPPQLLPLGLPLVRARQCLAQAAAAVSGGRLGELKTQLEAARANLEAYQGRAHAAEAEALVREIGAALGRPGGLAALQPAQLSLWSGRADVWVGAESG